ncbi:MAG: hypothetical protein M3680_17795 [Myxococcota bacterium]|nr:hypothetical protein [Myxococcota bacterium]
MRGLLVLLLTGVIGAGIAFRHLPHQEARAQPAERSVRAREVQSVAIDQIHSGSLERGLPLADLRALLTTSAGELLEEARLAADRRALAAALIDRGYLAAQVGPASVTFDRGGGAHVVFDVERGPMFHVGSIAVTGPGARDAHVVRLATGDDASARRIARARETLVETLARRGARADVELVLHDRPATATVDVELATR